MSPRMPAKELCGIGKKMARHLMVMISLDVWV
jgi:hypothetical protein